MSAGEGGPLRVPLYHDFASSLCYVTHRVMEELAEEVGALGIALDWRPIDLARLRGLKRGAALRPSDRDRVSTVARDMGVPLRIPTGWLDSRAVLAAAAAAAAETDARAAAFRERAYAAIYEQGLAPESAEDVARLTRDLGWAPSPDALAAGARRVAAETEAARGAQVTGVPTFQLGAWPFGGIQRRDTMLRVFERFARKAREGSLVIP